MFLAFPSIFIICLARPASRTISCHPKRCPCSFYITHASVRFQSWNIKELSIEASWLHRYIMTKNIVSFKTKLTYCKHYTLFQSRMHRRIPCFESIHYQYYLQYLQLCIRHTLHFRSTCAPFLGNSHSVIHRHLQESSQLELKLIHVTMINKCNPHNAL